MIFGPSSCIVRTVALAAERVVCGTVSRSDYAREALPFADAAIAAVHDVDEGEPYFWCAEPSDLHEAAQRRFERLGFKDKIVHGDEWRPAVGIPIAGATGRILNVDQVQAERRRLFPHVERFVAQLHDRTGYQFFFSVGEIEDAMRVLDASWWAALAVAIRFHVDTETRRAMVFGSSAGLIR